MVLTDKGQEAVVTASEGHQVIERGQRFLVLDRGERVQTDLGTGAKTLSRFDSARLLIGEVADAEASAPDMRSMSTPELFRIKQRDAKAELVWRLGLIWATFNMVLAGLSLAAGNARRNSNWNLVYALLVFVVYFNLLSLSQTWVAKGKMVWPVALWVVHGSLTLGALAVIWWRDGALIGGRPLGRGEPIAFKPRRDALGAEGGA
jgi:lipopolysaccharide export system permease protein